MNIAFLLQVHKNSEQIKSLISCLLNDDKHHFFIHVDKKSEALYQVLREFYANHEQVHVIEERVIVNWCGCSNVKAVLSLMRNVHCSTTRFDRVQLMSGEDFPVKSTSFINTFFEKNRHKEFITYEDIRGFRWRILRYNFFSENIHNRNIMIRIFQKSIREIQKKLFPERKILKNFTLYKGSAWFNFSVEAMEYILNYIDNHQGFLDQFKYSACTDEHFFQIVLLNSDFKKNVVNNNLYYIEWGKGKNSPNYLSKQKLQQIKSDEGILFARKIDEGVAMQLSEACR